MAPIADVKPDTLLSEFTVNAIGPLVLFNAFSSLLDAAGGEAKFVVISSAAGSITDAVPFALNSYGTSKAAVNFLTKKIDMESPKVTAFPMQ
jgi:norsolorinic acid ketoreductase